MLNRVIQLYKRSYSGLSREIWLLSVVMLINRSGTMVLAFMTLYCKHLGFSTGQAGTVVAVYGLGSLLGAFLGGKISDRIGFYPTQFGSLFLGGIFFMVLGQMASYQTIIAFTFLLSMVNESFRPANATAIAHYSTPENRTQAFSLVRLAINIGWGIGAALGGILASFDYSWLFWTDGATSITASLMLLLLLPKVHSGFKKYSSHEQKTVPQGLSPYKDKVFLIFLVLQVTFAFCFFQLFTTVPVYLKESLHLPEYQIGTLMAANGIIIALFEMVLVFSLEGRRPYLLLMCYGTMLMALAFIILNLPVPGGFILAAAFILMLTLSEMIAMPFMNTFYISRSTQFNRGQYAGLYTMAWSTAQVAGSAAGAWLALHVGFKNLWFSIFAICMLTAVGYYVLHGYMKKRHL